MRWCSPCEEPVRFEQAAENVILAKQQPAMHKFVLRQMSAPVVLQLGQSALSKWPESITGAAIIGVNGLFVQASEVYAHKWTTCGFLDTEH